MKKRATHKRQKLFLITFILILLCVCSCHNTNKPIEKVHFFDDDGWLKDVPVKFDIQIDDTTNLFQVILFLTHQSDYIFSNLIFSMSIITPDGGERQLNFVLDIKDENRNFLGTKTGQVWKTQFAAMKKTGFSQSGIYQFVFHHHMPVLSLRHLSELGIKIQTVKE
jgi:gliding motility-associated lipoprotein GldH